MESKTDNPPAKEGDPEPSETRSITALYGRLADRAPAILWVDEWAAWVCKGDIPPTQFSSLQAYLDEFPYHVEVTENLVVVTDPGFGNGAMEWVMRGFQLADGNWIVALTETDANQESSECKLWIGQPFEDDWLDLTDTALPSISRRDFFDDRADLRVLEEYELVSLQYILARNGNELAVQAKPNIAFECQGGKLELEDLPSEDATLICQAWDSFLPQPIICNFDSVKGVFVLQR